MRVSTTCRVSVQQGPLQPEQAGPLLVGTESSFTIWGISTAEFPAEAALHINGPLGFSSLIISWGKDGSEKRDKEQPGIHI